MPALETTCPVLTREPEGFWQANKLGKWIERGAPAIQLHQIGHVQLELAEMVQNELDEGQAAFQKRANATADALANRLEGLKRK